MTGPTYPQEYNELIERLRIECSGLVASAENIPSHDDSGYSSVGNEFISKITDILATLNWLDRRMESIEPKPMKKFKLTAYETRYYTTIVKAESEEQALALGDDLDRGVWEDHADDSAEFEIKEVEEIDEED